MKMSYIHAGTDDSPSDPVSDSLTVIITTSPTPSAPSTELLSAVLDSFRARCPELLACPVIVVFDTYDRIVEGRPRLKKGLVTPEGAMVYKDYKENVKSLFLRAYDPSQALKGMTYIESWSSAEYGSPCDPNKLNAVSLSIKTTPDGKVTFIEPEARLGFALAVRSALREAATPYVWVHQHDWTLQRAVPIQEMLYVMRARRDDERAPVRYICLPSPRMLGYADSGLVADFKVLREITSELRTEFVVKRSGSGSGSSGSKSRGVTFPSPETNTPAGIVRYHRNPGSEGDSEAHTCTHAEKAVAVPLTPIFFWHDKPHIVDRLHYLDRVFPSRLAVARGMFIEDSVGQRARDQMKQGLWAKWACWLYALDEDVVRHQHGRVFEGAEEEKAKIERLREAGKAGKAGRSGGKSKDARGVGAVVEGVDDDGGVVERL